MLEEIINENFSSFDKKIKTRLKEKQNSTNAKQDKYNKNHTKHITIKPLTIKYEGKLKATRAKHVTLSRGRHN